MCDEFLYGLDEIERKIIEKCNFFLNNKEEKIKFKLGIIPTILFYGLPGTGKTVLINKIYGKLKGAYNIDFYRLDFEEILSSNLGESSKNLIKFFNGIKEDIKENNSKAFIVLEEIDSFTLHRYNKHENTGVMRTLLTFNKEIDKLIKGNYLNEVVIIATTNIIENIDSAILRRFFIKQNFNLNLKKKDFKNYLTELLEIVESEVLISDNQFNELFELYNREKFTLGEIKLSFAHYYLEHQLNNLLKYDSKFLLNNKSAFKLSKLQNGSM